MKQQLIPAQAVRSKRISKEGAEDAVIVKRIDISPLIFLSIGFVLGVLHALAN